MSEPTAHHEPHRPDSSEAADATEQTPLPPATPKAWDAPPAEGAAPEGSDTAAFSVDGPDLAAPAPAEHRGAPLGTLVFGLVVVALGLLILVSVFYSITLSGGTVAIALFLGAGLFLVVGGIIAARRSARTGRSGS